MTRRGTRTTIEIDDAIATGVGMEICLHHPSATHSGWGLIVGVKASYVTNAFGEERRRIFWQVIWPDGTTALWPVNNLLEEILGVSAKYEFRGRADGDPGAGAGAGASSAVPS